MLQVWQQLSGINTVMYYGPEILKDAGIGDDDPEKVLMRSIPLGAVLFVGTAVSLFFTDNLGRRFMMVRALPLLGIGMFVLAIGMYLIYFGNM